MNIKVIPLLTALFMLLCMFASCSEIESKPQSESPESESVPSTSIEQSEEPSRAVEESSDYYDDGLPEIDFDGKDFVILQRSEYKYEFAEDENATEKVNTLIKERNDSIEQRFGIKIRTIEEKGSWDSASSFLSFIDNIRKQVSGALADYHLISGYAAITPTLISEDLFINWYELSDRINFKKSWWSQDFIDEMTVNGRLYLLAGDISLTFWESMQCMFFNKDLAYDNHLDNIYQTVNDGDWTFDYMHQVIKDSFNHTDDPNSQIYGYVTGITTQIDVYQDAFDIHVTEKDAEGRPVYTINSEKTYTALQKVYDLVVDKEYTKTFTESDNQIQSVKLFGEGKALFAPLRLGDGTLLQSYENLNYGILPMPKFNKEQDAYHSTCADYYSVFAIPITAAEQLDFIGIITEALCAESSRSVVPEYYNIVLKERNTSDEDSIKMIEEVREGLLCNFGYLYSYTLEWPAHQLNICVKNKNNSFASVWEASQDIFQSNLDEVIAYYFDN